MTTAYSSSECPERYLSQFLFQNATIAAVCIQRACQFQRAHLLPEKLISSTTQRKNEAPTWTSSKCLHQEVQSQHVSKGAMLILLFCFVLLCFCFFMCFPCLFGMFLSFCYMFLSVFSVFFDFVVFSFQFATHFGKFRVAVSQISHVSSILRLFLSILLMFFIIAVCSFQSDVCRSHFVYFVQVFRSHA